MIKACAYCFCIIFCDWLILASANLGWDPMVLIHLVLLSFSFVKSFHLYSLVSKDACLLAAYDMHDIYLLTYKMVQIE